MRTNLQTTTTPNFGGLFKITDKRIAGAAQQQSKELAVKLRELVFDEFATRTSVNDTPVLVAANSKDSSLSAKLKALGLKYAYKGIDPEVLHKRGWSAQEMASSFSLF